MLGYFDDPNHKASACPSEEVMKIISILTSFCMPVRVAEIGIGMGATALPIAMSLGKEDSYYMFDFDTSVSVLKADLAKRLTIKKDPPQIFAYGNSHKTFDSYAWSLCKFMLEEAKCQPFFDLAYLDGAHLLVHDLGATAVLKELIKRDGYLVFDDIEWLPATSPSCNPKTYPQISEQLTEEQINTPAVKMITKALMDTDERFERIRLKCGSLYRGVYKRIK